MTSLTIVSILIFGVGGLIAWPEVIVMMCGSTVGGYLGGRYTKSVNERILSVAVIIFGRTLSLVYFFRCAGFRLILTGLIIVCVITLAGGRKQS